MRYEIRFLAIIIILIIVGGCEMNSERALKDITTSTFETKQISKGNNNPNIDISKDSLDLLLIALHYGLPIKEIENSFNWNKSTTKKNIDLLIKNGLLKENNNVYIPTMGIFPLEMGNILIKKSQKVANEIADSIKIIIPQIKNIHAQMDISEKYSFNDLSFFYLSDILLDMGQIGNVEKEFLKKERPLRNEKRYYLAILEKDTTKNTEPFGIYGNQGLKNDDTIYIGVYGNTRTKSNIGWDDYKNKNIHYFNKKDFDIFYNQMLST
jgi:predicted DNA-binding transcriptional regulator